jgi:dUTPase
MPDRKPFKVYIVNKLDTTERGEGGLGSTGDGGLKIT